MKILPFNLNFFLRLGSSGSEKSLGKDFSCFFAVLFTIGIEHPVELLQTNKNYFRTPASQFRYRYERFFQRTVIKCFLLLHLSGYNTLFYSRRKTWFFNVSIIKPSFNLLIIIYCLV